MLKKILCVLPQITGGGAERFFITFLQQIDRSEYQPIAALVRTGGGFDGEIPNDVKLHVLTDKTFSIKLFAPLGPFRYVLALRQLIDETKPDAILSFGSLFNGAVALAAHLSKFPNPVVLIEAIHQSSEISQHNFLEKWTRTFFLRHTYPLASAIVAVSEDVAKDLHNSFGIEKNIFTIHYGVDIEKIHTLSKQPVKHSWLSDSKQFTTIIACGRLVNQKGFDILLQAMSKVEKNAKLILIGDGQEKKNLESQIQKLKLQDKVDLIGYKRNPYQYLSKGDIFVLPSLWEGLPIMLLEAVVLGLPIISSDCPTGPRIILNNGECGILVPPSNPYALAKSINQLINDNQLRKQLSSAAFHRSEEFSAQKATREYLNLFSMLGNW